METAPTATTSRGALLNYDIYTQQGDESAINTFSELRAFNAAGVLSTTQLTQYSTEENADNSVERLDTSWRTSFPETMLAVTVGDTLTSSLIWSRPTRIGGIQIGTDFGLRPYMPTTPLPAYLGSATLPSNVELYVDGVRYYNGEVPAGSFQINTMPNISGAGTGQVMMTDALGRTSVQNFSFYNDQQLLREGLTAWSAELGTVRENYGYSSFDYASAPVLSGTWRRGFSNTFTAGTHAETSDGLINAGFSNDWIEAPAAARFRPQLPQVPTQERTVFCTVLVIVGPANGLISVPVRQPLPAIIAMSPPIMASRHRRLTAIRSLAIRWKLPVMSA